MFLTFGLMAQDKNQNTDFVILTSEFDQLDSLMIAAQDKSRDGEIELVFYGSEVKQLNNPDMEKYLEAGANSKVRFSVCKMSVDLLKLDRDSIPEGIEIVDNAFLHSLQLQKKGYKSLNL